MKKLMLLVLPTLILGACTYSDVNFETMSSLELAEYNRSQPLGQMIVCSDENRSFSRVRRRSCMTVEKMYGSAEQATQLGVLNAVQGFGTVE